jgi:hypothetical protein
MFLKENDSIRKKLIEINNKISNISIPNPPKELHAYELKLDFDLKGNKDLSYTIPFQVNHLGKKWIFLLKKRDNKIEFIIDFFLHQKQMNINEIQANLNLKFSLYWYENNQINSSNMIISNRKFEQKQFNLLSVNDISHVSNFISQKIYNMISFIFKYEIVYFP